MALPSSGEISLADVRAELGLTGEISLNQGTVRSLAGKASGEISLGDLRGKSSLVLVTVTPGTQGVSRGYYNGMYGSISDAVYEGRTILQVASSSSAQSTLNVLLVGKAVPGWTRVWVNGSSYPISWVSYKDAQAMGTATFSGAYALTAAKFTLGFS